MLIIICSKCGYASTEEVLGCSRCDISTELITKNKTIYIINPKISKWKVMFGSLLLIISLISIFTKYQAFAAICFIIGLTLALYDKFQDWCY